MNEQVQQVIDAVKAAAPFMWHAAYRYVIVDAIIGMACSIPFLGIAYWLMKKAKKSEDEGVLFCYIGMIVCLIIGSLFLLFNLEQFLTLDYSAMKAIAQMAVKQ